MALGKLLIANRGEIAIRIARAAAELEITTVAVYSEDDTASLHVQTADESRPLTGEGARAYLDAEQIVALAREAGCDAIHPGYGFLAEVAEFAAACAEAGLVFVGPSVRTLELFGDKVAARRFATSHDVPVLAGSANRRPIDGFSSKRSANTFLLGHGSHGSPSRCGESLVGVWGSQSRLSGRVVQGRRALVHSVLPGRRCRARAS